MMVQFSTLLNAIALRTYYCISVLKVDPNYLMDSNKDKVKQYPTVSNGRTAMGAYWTNLDMIDGIIKDSVKTMLPFSTLEEDNDITR